MEPRHSLSLTFSAPFNQKNKVRVPHANPNLTNEQVVDAMNQIISSNTLTTVAGPINGRQDARLTTSTTTNFELTNTV